MTTRRDAWRNGRKAWERLVRWAAARSNGAAGLDALEDVGTLRRLLDSAELDAVRCARAAGCSWAEIATCLGISRQAAWERWRELDERPSEAEEDAAAALVARAAAAQARQAELSRRSNVTVPNVIGKTWDDALTVLTDAGLAAVRSDPDAPPLEPSERSRRRIADQSPESGAKVPPGAAVRLWLDADEDGGSGVREPRRPLGPRPKAARELDYDADLAG